MSTIRRWCVRYRDAGSQTWWAYKPTGLVVACRKAQRLMWGRNRIVTITPVLIERKSRKREVAS